MLYDIRYKKILPYTQYTVNKVMGNTLELKEYPSNFIAVKRFVLYNKATILKHVLEENDVLEKASTK